MKRTCSRIRDGYFFTKTIPAKVDEYGELEIRYRPVLPEEVDLVFESREKGTAAYHAAVRTAMVEHLDAWSEWDEEKNEAVPITIDTVKTLPQGLFWAVWNQLFSTVEAEEEVKNLNEG